jgi:4-amino-4-deoxy-L-arabinose transferase-like glycosyltransferase
VSDTRLERLARWTPLLILAYFAAQFLIRIAFSANLETDEAQFVGHTAFALGYGNSHPPLYNWMVAAALWLTGGYWPAALALVKNLLLAGTYLLAFDIGRREALRALPGLLIAASFLLIPQIVWKSQVTLAHSVLVMFAVVAILHAVVCIVERGDAPSFAWLGLAAAIGAMAKYNLFLMLLAVLIAAFTVPAIRARLFTARLGLSALVLALLTAPHFLWAARNLGSTTERMAKLEREDPLLVAIDLPGIGIDGAIDLAVALITWIGPLAAAWFAIRALSREPDPASQAGEEKARAFAQLFGRTALIGFGIFAAIVLVLDMHSVRERYLTPLLMPLPFWLVFAWPLHGKPRAATGFLAIGGTVAVLMVTAWPLWIAFGREQLAYPYAAFAKAVDEAVSGPFAVTAHQDKFAANIAIRVEGGQMWEEGARPEQLVVVWDAKSASIPRKLAARIGEGYEPRGDVMAMSFPYDNLSGQTARLNAQLYARRP